MLVDSHCHLDYLERDDILDDVVYRAKNSGVDYMTTISVTMKDFPRVLDIANKYDTVFCSVGVHPCHVEADNIVTYDALFAETHHQKVIGIGESGIDLFYDATNLSAQEDSFRTHIALARETGLPVIVHTRSGDDDTIRIMRDEYKRGAYPSLIHCFTASRALAENALDMGSYISLSGIVTFPKSTDIRNIVRDIPINRLLVETDSPYLAPKPYRGKPCEPSYVIHTAEVLADVMGVDYPTICKQTTDNFFTLFTKAKR